MRKEEMRHASTPHTSFTFFSRLPLMGEQKEESSFVGSGGNYCGLYGRSLVLIPLGLPTSSLAHF